MKKRPATHSAAPWLTEADLPDIPPKDMEPSAKAAIMKERRRIQERLREQKRTLSRALDRRMLPFCQSWAKGRS